jgi:2-hydroxychromene-2-carboxylate isomerase
VSAQAVFYFDLASPLAYLASEQVMQRLGAPVDWQPVLSRRLADSPLQVPSREHIAERAQQLGLQQLRWPSPFPFDSSPAMHAATYARSIGRAIPFAQAAFRQAFAGGHNLEQADFVLIAAAACEMHPKAVLKGAALRSTAAELARATAAAAVMGIPDVPALLVDEQLFLGEHALEDACAHLGNRATPSRSQ